MTPRTRFRVYLGLSIVWTLMLAQAIGYAASGEGRITVFSVGLYATVQIALAVLCIRAWRSRRAAAS